MHTLPHDNPENGYSLRVGKNLPDNAANLAYVHTDSPEPIKNLSVINYAQDIPENRIKEPEIIKDLYTTSMENTNLFIDGTLTLKNLFPKQSVSLREHRNEQTLKVPFIKNHVYYIKRTVDLGKGEWNNLTGVVQIKEANNLKILDNFETEDNLFKYTGITTNNATLAFYGNFVPNKLGQQEAYFKDIILVDLTETFGVGKEKDIFFMRNFSLNNYFEKKIISISKNISDSQANVYTDILMQNDKPIIVYNEDVLLTNEFTLDKYELPLYYIYSLSEDVYLNNTKVNLYINGKKPGLETTFNKIEYNQWFILDNDKIKITKNDYQLLDENEAYKILGIPSKTEGCARLFILSNFKNNINDTYRVQYNSKQNNKDKYISETMNVRELFRQEDGFPIDNVFMRSYRLVPIASNVANKTNSYNNQGFYIQMKTNNQIKETELNALNRNPYNFTYQIESKVDVRFSQKNPVTINIGQIYVNENQMNVMPLTTAIKKLVSNQMFPSYINFKNPHHPAGDNLPESSSYWTSYLEMPEEHYLDYDVLFLTGYGSKNYTYYNKQIISFLNAGGTLIIDNNSNVSPLSFNDGLNKPSLFFDISFSKSQINNNLKYKNNNFNNRYYDEPSLDGVGNSFSIIELNNNLNIKDFNVLIESEEGQPAVISYQYGLGKIIVSNIGLMTDVILGNQNTHKMLVNLLIDNAEHRSFLSPLFKDYVIHKDDLLEEDYTGYYGEKVYFNSPNDYDSTQIVAKKLLGGRVGEVANKYLPAPYQNPYNALYSINVMDTQLIDLENNNFEKTASTLVFDNNNLNAIPGFRYIVQSKGLKSEGGLTKTTTYAGTQSLYLDYNQTKGYFEKEIIELQPGNYKLEGYVKSEGFTGGGFSVYNSEVVLIDENESVSGNTNWKLIELYFSLDKTETVYIRLGSSLKTASGKIFFDNINLISQGNVRMTKDNNGQEELYAYAIEAQGQNFLLGYMNNSDYTVVRSDIEINPTIRIRSFVYQWDNTTASYQKQFGKNSYIKTKLMFSDNEKLVDNLINLIPANESGYQWSYPQNIFYQIEIDVDDPYYNYVDLCIYDPETNQYFYSRNGQLIINREDLWGTNVEPITQLRIKSKMDNLKITGAKYTLVKLNNGQIELTYPNTNEEEDRWYVRIRNGSFVRNAFNHQDIKTLTKNGLHNYNKEYIQGEHQYSIPEYHRQTFYPRKGERLIENEKALYVNPHLIKLQKTPLIIKESKLHTPLYNFDGDKKTFRSLDTFWDKRYPVTIYQDEQIMNSGYEINYEEGFVKFDNEVPNNIIVFAKYQQNNVRIFRRKLSNQRIENEMLKRIDNTSMKLSKEHIAISPSPIFYRNGIPINPNEYWIDFENGILNFYQTNNKNIQANYSYYIYEELNHTDINSLKGEISLKEEIHFLDEIVVNYIYQEDFLEYKGYYDEENNTFLHLDLNPTAGHTFTNKLYKNNTFVGYEEESSERLLNKTIYFYLLPHYSKYVNKILKEEHVVRHCFSEKEWLYIKTENPSAILLGTVLVRENTNLNNIIMLDARRLGGGLKETIKDETIYKKLGYTSALWDVGGFDGLSYYKNAVTIIKIPKEVLKVHGGDFSEDTVSQIIDKYLALGVFPIIEYI